MARQWFAAGAHMIGGCCRTRPDHVRLIAEQWTLNSGQ
jgi:homocysteine S-methyltransferase